MKKKLLKFITFQNPLFSPNKIKSHVEKGFSGQIIQEVHQTAAEAEEPTSPKVSCMGRIKHKNKQRQNKKLVLGGPKAKESTFRVFFVKPQEKRSGIPRPRPKIPERASKAPGLSHMRRSASAYNSLTGFDWRAQGMIHAPSHDDSEGENEVKIPFSAPMIMCELGGCREVNIELKPKKEINLWKRRTMAQPRPLQVAPLR